MLRPAALAVLLALGLLAPPALAAPKDKDATGAESAGEEASSDGGGVDSGGDVAPLPSVEEVKAQFAAAFPQECAYALEAGDPSFTDPTVDEIRFKYASDDTERTMQLYTFQCGGGAYNFTQVYYSVNEYGEITLLDFAVPHLNLKYVNGDSEGELESVTIDGWSGTHQLVNSYYDPDSRSIIDFSKWRGLGDASSSGTYTLVGDQFILIKYEVDATYDDQINPETILDLP